MFDLRLLAISQIAAYQQARARAIIADDKFKKKTREEKRRILNQVLIDFIYAIEKVNMESK